MEINTHTPTVKKQVEPNSDIQTEEDLEQALFEASQEEATPMTAKDWEHIRRQGDAFIASIKSA